MTAHVGTLVFARFGSSRLPGKALRTVGGMPLLARVIQRAQCLSWPVYLATTAQADDDALVALAKDLAVPVFRGSVSQVAERAVGAARTFQLDAFIRLCGDRPLFSLADMDLAAKWMTDGLSTADLNRTPDLVTNYLYGDRVRGLTTEVVLTQSLASAVSVGLTDDQQEHVTRVFYDNPGKYRLVSLPTSIQEFSCPGFAVDTEEDLVRMNAIFSANPALDLTAEQADGILRS